MKLEYKLAVALALTMAAFIAVNVTFCAAHAEDVTYASRVQASDGSIVTTGSDGSRYHSRPQATDDSWATQGTDADGESITATTRTQASDGSKVTVVRSKK